MGKTKAKALNSAQRRVTYEMWQPRNKINSENHGKEEFSEPRYKRILEPSIIHGLISNSKPHKTKQNMESSGPEEKTQSVVNGKGAIEARWLFKRRLWNVLLPERGVWVSFPSQYHMLRWHGSSHLQCEHLGNWGSCCWGGVLPCLSPARVT